MVREINGLGGVPTTNKTSDQSTKKAAPETTEQKQTGEGGNAPDGVELSREARTLQSLTDQVKDLPDANLERAEQIKLALESGEYKIDDLVVADKLLQASALFDK